MIKVAVQGLGFVGSAVAIAISSVDKNGAPHFQVFGVERDDPKGKEMVELLNSGQSCFSNADEDFIGYLHAGLNTSCNLKFGTDKKIYSEVDVVVCDVGMDVKLTGTYDSQEVEVLDKPFMAAITDIFSQIKPDTLVIIETTLPPGMVEKRVVRLAQEVFTSRGIDATPLIAYCYERVMPGKNYINSILNYPRTIGSANKEALNKACLFYNAFCEKNLTVLRDATSVELAKVLENSYRATNIAFIHEWTLYAEAIGVNLFDVIQSIKVRKGTHDNIMKPGFGVGGYCLTKDSLLAQWSINNIFEIDHSLELTLNALKVNYKMPLHTFQRLKNVLKSFHDKTLLICGVSYLADVGDIRNTPANQLATAVDKEGGSLIWHDPLIELWDHPSKPEKISELEVGLRNADAVVFCLPQKEYCQLNLQALNWDKIHLTAWCDTFDIFSDEDAAFLFGRGIIPVGIGKGHWKELYE
jgi:UDP-N-acetyl-D-glucosamine dehydrogenase